MMNRMPVLMILAAVMTLSVGARAERVEVGLAATPTWLFDSGYAAFSEGDLFVGRLGVDIRSQVGTVGGFQFAPLLGYRFGKDSGFLTWDIDTYLYTHDVYAGLRVRRELISWLSLFVEIDAGAMIAVMDADMYVGGDDPAYSGEPKDAYSDTGATWNVSALFGVETHLSRRWLESRGNDWFCFGGEIAVGYARRGDISFDPSLNGGSDNAISSETLGEWGDVNLSGLIVQFAASLYFI